MSPGDAVHCRYRATRCEQPWLAAWPARTPRWLPSRETSGHPIRSSRIRDPLASPIEHGCSRQRSSPRSAEGPLRRGALAVLFEGIHDAPRHGRVRAGQVEKRVDLRLSIAVADVQDAPILAHVHPAGILQHLLGVATV